MWWPWKREKEPTVYMTDGLVDEERMREIIQAIEECDPVSAGFHVIDSDTVDYLAFPSVTIPEGATVEMTVNLPPRVVSGPVDTSIYIVEEGSDD